MKGNDAAHVNGALPFVGWVETVNDCPIASLGVSQVPATVTSDDVWREAEVAFVTCAVIGGMSSAAALVAAP